jgi:hypothetical protein
MAFESELAIERLPTKTESQLAYSRRKLRPISKTGKKA